MKFFFVALIGISIIMVLVPHILYAIAKLLGLVFHFRVSYKPWFIASATLLLLWLCMAFYGREWGRFTEKTTELAIKCGSLPDSFRGYRIVHISDLHLDGWVGHEAKMQEIVSKINALCPDAIVFTGDLVSLSEDELTPFVPILKSLHAKDGVFSVLGNHDYMPYNRSWSQAKRTEHLQKLMDMQRRELGWHLLANENFVIRKGNDSIAIVGSENQSMGVHSVVKRGNLQQAMQGTDGMFRILLTHDPTHWRCEVLRKTDIPLTLSGHTHGGQVGIPGLFHVSTFIYKEHAGLYNENNQTLYVSTGIGGTMPMRVGVPAEITLITLDK